METAPEESGAEAFESYDEDESALETMTGLVDPEKPTSEMDVARAADLALARNLRRLEIHRYEIAAALESMSEEDLTHLDDEEEQIELTESDEKLLQHVARVNEQRRKRQNKRLTPGSGDGSRLAKLSSLAQALINRLPGESDGSSLGFMKQNLSLAWHNWRYDREIEQRLFSPSRRFRPLRRTRTLREREQQAPCAPTKLVSWSLDCIAAYQEGGSFRHFTFIDPVAGHGRTLLLASHRDFREIIGVENRGKLAEDAAMNIAQYPRTFMAQREVKLVTRDYRLIEWPDQPLIIHMFAPQSAEWLEQILEDISASFEALPRQIYLVIIGNRYRDVPESFDYIHSFTPPSTHLEMMALASPYEVDFHYFAPPAE